MIRVLDSAGSTLVEWGRQQQQQQNTDCDYFMSIDEFDYKINNSQLAKDLGVTFDPKLNFNHHIYEITHKATKTLGILKRTFLFLNKKNIYIII